MLLGFCYSVKIRIRLGLEKFLPKDITFLFTCNYIIYIFIKIQLGF